MNRKRVMGIALLVAALIVLAGGGLTLFLGHMKTGIGLFVLALIVIGGGLFTIFSSSSAERGRLDTEWM